MDNTLTNERTHTSSKTRILAQIGMLGAISVVLMLFEIPLPFAPAFYEIDFSEVPVLVGCFAMGPVAGAAIELIKILLNFAINGTITAGVGELANFLLGCSFVVPAGIIYRKMHTRKGAIIGMATGTVLMTIFGCFLTAVNAHITSLFTFVAFAVAPFNILKGIIDSLIVFLIYKKIRPVFRMQ